jgi:hypothetical protein
MLLFYLAAFVVNVVCAAICFEKGKTWTAVLGFFLFGPALYVGAIRLAKPNSKWACKYEGHPWKMKMSLDRFPKERMIIESMTEEAGVVVEGAAA